MKNAYGRVTYGQELINARENGYVYPLESPRGLAAIMVGRPILDDLAINELKLKPGHSLA